MKKNEVHATWVMFKVALFVCYGYYIADRIFLAAANYNCENGKYKMDIWAGIHKKSQTQSETQTQI